MLDNFISVIILSDFIEDDWIISIDLRLFELSPKEIDELEILPIEVFCSEGIDVLIIFVDEIFSEIVVDDILSVKLPIKLFDEDIVSVRYLLFIIVECGNSIKLSVINICSKEKDLLLDTSEIASVEKSSFPHFFAI